MIRQGKAVVVRRREQLSDLTSVSGWQSERMRFWKMHGLGNDDIGTDSRNQKISDVKAAKLAKKLCERRFSVGADGLLLVCNSTVADVKMRILNADGSEAETWVTASDASVSTATKTESLRKMSFRLRRCRALNMFG